MGIFKKIFLLYYEGFKNMSLGKSLWIVIILKLLVIFCFLKIFIYGEGFKERFLTQEERSEFVSKNLVNF
ncbi:DUF4492 domain-containing protein [Helicobacter valdiviensis]|uniref:DUF4492 domain-containing protein n=1 Tax=Helicobacter valdiviensis TaxID=1458358 RepID=A0A2W6MXC3_9HELI|nr:DUF4492 domain-containing protein [Helicobacter valdiviensis]PZT48992.1 DUF4492 domain-containing protein [Helicobacter valdiviensis]